MELTRLFYVPSKAPVVGISLLLLISAPALQAQNTLHVLDVGYGTAVHLECGAQNYLFDTGPKEAASHILEHLADEGVTRLEGIFLSHTHKDHAGGLLPLMRQMKTENVLWNERYPPDEAIVSDLDEAQKLAEFQALAPGVLVMLCENVSLRVLKDSLQTDNLNERNLVFGIQHRKTKVLLPGDAGLDRQRNLVELEKEWIKGSRLLIWPHHGDQMETSFLSLLGRVKHCVVSVGENPYRLPHADFETQAQRICVDLSDTRYDGDVTFLIHNNVTLLKTSKQRVPVPTAQP